LDAKTTPQGVTIARNFTEPTNAAQPAPPPTQLKGYVADLRRRLAAAFPTATKEELTA
jgi:hypothetical protein